MNTSAHPHNLADTLLQVVQGIQAKNNEVVLECYRRSGGAETVAGAIRRTATHVVHRLSAGAMRSAKLWALPVVIEHNAHLLMPAQGEMVNVKSEVLTSAIEESFSPQEQVRYLFGMLSYDALSQMLPAHLHHTCAALTGTPPGAKITVHYDLHEHPQDMPRLGFILGMAASINTHPSIHPLHGDKREKVRNTISAALGLSLGPIASKDALNIAVLQPQLLDKAIIEGLHLWLQVLARSCRFVSCSLKTLGGDLFGFALYVHCAREPQTRCLRFNVRATQVPKEEIGKLYAHIEGLCNMPCEVLQQRNQRLH